jgi:hypothetical protein
VLTPLRRTRRAPACSGVLGRATALPTPAQAHAPPCGGLWAGWGQVRAGGGEGFHLGDFRVWAGGVSGCGLVLGACSGCAWRGGCGRRGQKVQVNRLQRAQNADKHRTEGPNTPGKPRWVGVGVMQSVLYVDRTAGDRQTRSAAR